MRWRLTNMKAFRLAALSGCVVLLSSCLNLDADLTINSEALASGTYEVEVAKQAAALLGVSEPDDLKERLLEGEGGILPKGNSVEVEERGEFYVMTVTMNDVALTEEGMIAEVLEDGRVRFEFVNEESDDTSGFDAGLTGIIDMRVTMPGPILESEGFDEVDDVTVEYSGPVTEAVVLSVVSEAGTGGGSGFPFLPIAAVVVVGALAVIVLTRRKKSAPNTSMPEPPAVAPE